MRGSQPTDYHKSIRPTVHQGLVIFILAAFRDIRGSLSYQEGDCKPMQERSTTSS